MKLQSNRGGRGGRGGKLRNILSFAALSVLSGGIAVAADDFAAANSFYEKSDFANALPIYERLASEHPKEPSYHYNLGNTYLKTGRPGKAVASYLRAFRLAPRDGDVRY